MEDMAFKPHFLKRLLTTKSERIWFPHQLWLFFKFSDELLIMKTNNRFCIDFPCWLLPDSRFVEQPLLSDWVILKWWITCVSFIQRGYGEVWPPMGKVILVFFFFFWWMSASSCRHTGPWHQCHWFQRDSANEEYKKDSFWKTYPSSGSVCRSVCLQLIHTDSFSLGLTAVHYNLGFLRVRF